MTPKNKKSYIFFIFILFFFLPSTLHASTVQDLLNRYASALKTGDKIRILIVPGHDNQYWGTQYRDIRESDLTLVLGEDLYSLLKNDPRFDVMITRTWQNYTPVFAAYFTDYRNDILQFINDKRTTTANQISNGTLKEVTSVPHNSVNQDVAVRLYGINKWANEHAVDLMIHIHFNDTPTRPANNPGPYKGVTVYIPESQYGNAAISRSFGKALYDVISPLYPPSTMPGEDAGLVEDQTLIALGASNTLTNTASTLIEYGYIYEPQLLDYDISNAVMGDMAYQTFLGIHNFFGDKTRYEGKYATPLLPYTWKTPITQNAAYNSDVLALQAALRNQGLFPDKTKDPDTCRMTGIFNPCTKAALMAFQKKYGIDQTGTLGPITRKKLNSLFGG